MIKQELEQELKYGKSYEINMGYKGAKAVYIGRKSIDGHLRRVVIQRGNDGGVYAYRFSDFQIENGQLIMQGIISAKKLRGIEAKTSKEMLEARKL